MKIKATAIFLAFLLLAEHGYAFCGFFVSKVPASLFNHKSEVILVRDNNHSVITLSNDFQGDVSNFAMVVPVPVVLREDQIRIVNRGVFDRLDAYSAPRLVEYYDPNPCIPMVEYEVLDMAAPRMSQNKALEKKQKDDAANYQVKIEAKYAVGEYDILILSAKQSDGLERWLSDNGYRIPNKAAEVLEPYIKNNTKFFVAKVNLDRHNKSGFNLLNPIQMEFESNKFGLPIRLGMANAEKEQDLVVYAFTRKGRVEPVNYRSVKIPSNRNVPLFVENYFGAFYKDLFARSYYREGRNAVFLEYAWNVSPRAGVKCDPCVSPPPVFADFKEAGVNWISGMNSASRVFFTRMHVRYSRDKFPQDLQFQITPNTENFQARYILHHPAKGDLNCSAGNEYREQLEDRRRVEVAELKVLAGWTNPNYADYITEYSLENRDKYAPNRNDIQPSGAPVDDPKSGLPAKIAFLIFGILGLVLLWAFRRRALQAG